MITRPRNVTQSFSWRAELWSLASGCAWIGGTLMLWYVLIRLGLR